MSMSIIRSRKPREFWDVDVARPAYWLSLHPDASRKSIVTLATGASTVTDVSGSNYTAVQATPANQPSYNATGFNGYPTLAFDGINDHFTFTLNPVQAYNQTCFAVVDTASLGIGNRIFLQRNQSGLPALYFGLEAVGNYRPSIFWSTAFAGQSSAVQRKALFFWQIGGANTGFNRTDVDAQNLVSQANNQASIGFWVAINSNFGAQLSAINLSELILINNPTQSVIDRVHGVLAHRWWRLAGQPVPLPVSHPYYLVPPTL